MQVWVLSKLDGTVHGVFTTREKAIYWANQITEIDDKPMYLQETTLDRMPDMLWPVEEVENG